VDSSSRTPPAPTVGSDAARAERLAHAEAEAQAALRDKIAFIERLGAEMGAGLRGVLALAELLETQPLGGEAPAYVRSLADCSRTLLNLAADAVELSRPDGALDFVAEPVRLRDLLDAVEVQWRPRAAEDGVALGAAFHGDATLAAELDPARLKQIYGALIGHALRSTRRGGVEASLQAHRDGDRVIIQGQVRDTGRGLEDVRGSSLFQPFGGPPTSGLELALAKRLVDAMGGRIWAENNPGAGSTLAFQFDAPACAAPAETDASSEAEAPPLAGHLLIVDDNATNRMVAQTLVELFGCTCDLAADGIEAVEAATRSRYDAVLMDIRMPRMDGLAATRAIHAAPGLQELPIIALTANADAEDLRAHERAGMAGTVDKPIKADRLLTTLQTALARKHPPKRARAAA
jgi:CheY-like chemotaxis protein